MCGTTLGGGSFGYYDATRPLAVIRHPGPGRLSFLVSRTCAHGSHVTWTPSSAARLTRIVRARDGRAHLVILTPATPHAAFRLTATRNGKLTASVTVRLRPWPRRATRQSPLATPVLAPSAAPEHLAS